MIDGEIVELDQERFSVTLEAEEPKLHLRISPVASNSSSKFRINSPGTLGANSAAATAGYLLRQTSIDLEPLLSDDLGDIDIDFVKQYEETFADFVSANPQMFLHIVSQNQCLP